LLTDGHLACGETFLKCEERTGVLAVGADDGEDGDVLVCDGIEKPPVALRSRSGSGK
jgi:hypothetical protein